MGALDTFVLGTRADTGGRQHVSPSGGVCRHQSGHGAPGGIQARLQQEPLYGLSVNSHSG